MKSPKLRIIEEVVGDKSTYYVQRKGWFFWSTLEQCAGAVFTIPAPFKSLCEAREAALLYSKTCGKTVIIHEVGE